LQQPQVLHRGGGEVAAVVETQIAGQQRLDRQTGRPVRRSGENAVVPAVQVEREAAVIGAAGVGDLVADEEIEPRSSGGLRLVNDGRGVDTEGKFTDNRHKSFGGNGISFCNYNRSHCTRRTQEQEFCRYYCEGLLPFALRWERCR
jgi:hypothetical protein